MKRVLKWVLLPALGLVLVLVGVANLLAESPEDLAPPDPAMLITLPDGRSEPLGELLARLTERAEESPPPETEAASEEGASPATAGLEPSEGAEVTYDEAGNATVTFRWPPPVDPDDPFSLGRQAMWDGRAEEALALLQSVPEDHDKYDHAQRYIGWELLTKRMDKPRLGLAYMNRALDARPLDGENWQDASRVYLRTLGIRWDPVSNTMR